MAAASGTVKKVALELGGKNPNIVFADADRETALDMAMTAVFLHSGQVCSAGARLVVEESIAEEFVAELVERARDIRLGGPVRREGRDRRADLAGPPRQGHRLRRGRRRRGRHRARAAGTGSRRRAGRRLLLRADRPRRRAGRHERRAARSPSGRCSPWRPSPTRTTPCASPTTPSTGWPARSGPRTPARASGSRPGCGWARSGSTTTTPTSPQAEWGGYKQSGIGRELGSAGLEEYRETKHIWHNIAPAASALVRRGR